MHLQVDKAASLCIRPQVPAADRPVHALWSTCPTRIIKVIIHSAHGMAWPAMQMPWRQMAESQENCIRFHASKMPTPGIGRMKCAPAKFCQIDITQPCACDDTSMKPAFHETMSDCTRHISMELQSMVLTYLHEDCCVRSVRGN